ncbi:M20/M25/M40 family metallo-hydrolase [bacterium]|nr:M20/M25/M40 family metallo-hydrolase [bacterium]
MKKVADHLEKTFQNHLNDLKELVKIPSVSFPGFPESEVRRSAEAVKALLEKRGLENCKILEIPGAHPYIYGERLKAPGKPTLLLYAHHDVQPPGVDAKWRTKPFEPTLKEGPGGERLFGRGTADDKAGVVAHTSSIAAYLETLGELPVNVKVVIEGEEEIGSPHLLEFLKTYRKQLDADVLVLTDCTNIDIGMPSLTIALRGMVGVGIEVRGLNNSVHSGMWGGPVPDPAMALSKMLASLVDENGKIAITGVLEQVRPLSKSEEADMNRLPFDEEAFRKQAGVRPGVELLKEGPNPLGQIWRFPSLTVNAFEASSRKNAGNIINESAWAKVTIRLVAGMNPEKVLEQLKTHLHEKTPWGLEVKFEVESCTGPWDVIPKGPAFEAAKIAMKKGYGVEPYMLGCGGTIPFVQPFEEALGGAPALLVGVEDPYTNAHGENESLLVEDFKKACLSQVYLFSEISENFKK